MKGHRCQECVRVRDAGYEATACGKPADWYLETAGTDAGYWACESHAREALLYMGAECWTPSGEPLVVDPETHDLVVQP